jgi:hypothetical protein
MVYFQANLGEFPGGPSTKQISLIVIFNGCL